MCTYQYLYYSACCHQTFILLDYCDKYKALNPQSFKAPVPSDVTSQDTSNVTQVDSDSAREDTSQVSRLRRTQSVSQGTTSTDTRRRRASFPDSCLSRLYMYRERIPLAASMDLHMSLERPGDATMLPDASPEHHILQEGHMRHVLSREELNVNVSKGLIRRTQTPDGREKLHVSHDCKVPGVNASLENHGPSPTSYSSRNVSGCSLKDAATLTMFPPLQDTTNSSVQCTVSVRSSSNTLSQVSWAQVAGGSSSNRPEQNTATSSTLCTRAGTSGSDALTSSSTPTRTTVASDLQSPAARSTASPSGKAYQSIIPILILPDSLFTPPLSDSDSDSDRTIIPDANTSGVRRNTQQAMTYASVLSKPRAAHASPKTSGETSAVEKSYTTPEKHNAADNKQESPADGSGKAKSRAPTLQTAQRAAMRELRRKESIIGQEPKSPAEKRLLRPAASCGNLRKPDNSGSPGAGDALSPTVKLSPSKAGSLRSKSPIRFGMDNQSYSRVGPLSKSPTRRVPAGLSPSTRRHIQHTPHSSITSSSDANFVSAQHSPHDDGSPNSFVTAIEMPEPEDTSILSSSPTKTSQTRRDTRADERLDVDPGRTIRVARMMPAIPDIKSHQVLRNMDKEMTSNPGVKSTEPKCTTAESRLSNSSMPIRDVHLASISAGSHIPLPIAVARSRKNSVASNASISTTKWRPELGRLESERSTGLDATEKASVASSDTIPFPAFEPVTSDTGEVAEAWSSVDEAKMGSYIAPDRLSYQESRKSSYAKGGSQIPASLSGSTEVSEGPGPLSRANSLAKRRESIEEIKRATLRRGSSAAKAREMIPSSPIEEITSPRLTGLGPLADKAVPPINEGIHEGYVQERNYRTEPSTRMSQADMFNSMSRHTATWDQPALVHKGNFANNPAVNSSGPVLSIAEMADQHRTQRLLKLAQKREALAKSTNSSDLRPDAPVFVPGQGFSRPPLPMDWQFPSSAVTTVNSINAAPTFATTTPVEDMDPNESPLHGKGKKKKTRTNKKRSDTVNSYPGQAPISASESLAGALQPQDQRSGWKPSFTKWKPSSFEESSNAALSPRTYSQSYGGFRKRPFYDCYNTGKRYDQNGVPVQQYRNDQFAGNPWAQPHIQQSSMQPYEQIPNPGFRVAAPYNQAGNMLPGGFATAHPAGRSYRPSGPGYGGQCLSLAPANYSGMASGSPISLRGGGGRGGGGGGGGVGRSVRPGPDVPAVRREYVGYSQSIKPRALKNCGHYEVITAIEIIGGPKCPRCAPDEHNRGR